MPDETKVLQICLNCNVDDTKSAVQRAKTTCSSNRHSSAAITSIKIFYHQPTNIQPRESQIFT